MHVYNSIGQLCTHTYRQTYIPLQKSNINDQSQKWSQNLAQNPLKVPHKEIKEEWAGPITADQTGAGTVGGSTVSGHLIKLSWILSGCSNQTVSGPHYKRLPTQFIKLEMVYIANEFVAN